MPLFPVRRDAASAEFFEGAAAGLFLLVHDRETGQWHDPQFDRSIDPQRYMTRPAAGSGRVVSWSIVHRRTSNGESERQVVGIVELTEGPWWWTEILDADPDADLMGAPVVVAFPRVGSPDDEVQPCFQLAPAE